MGQFSIYCTVVHIYQMHAHIQTAHWCEWFGFSLFERAHANAHQQFYPENKCYSPSKTLCTHRWIDWHHCCFFNSMLIEAFVWIVVIILLLKKKYDEWRENPSMIWNSIHYTAAQTVSQSVSSVCMHIHTHTPHSTFFILLFVILYRALNCVATAERSTLVAAISVFSVFLIIKTFQYQCFHIYSVGYFCIEFISREKEQKNEQ